MQANLDPFRYGWRDVHDGRIPLTSEDVLHPQLGDKIPESSSHSEFRCDLANILRWKASLDPSAYVLSRCGIFWMHPTIRHFAPDIAMFSGIEQPTRILMDEVYQESTYKQRPWLIIEIVTPHMRECDLVIKFRDYHELKIETYIVVDQEDLEQPWSILGFRYRTTGYERILENERGHIELGRIGLSLGIESNRVRCYEIATGERVPDYSELHSQLAELRRRSCHVRS